MTEPLASAASTASRNAPRTAPAPRGPLPFVLLTLLTAAVLRTVSLTLHYLGPSPWGGPLVLSPDRFLPDALFIEWGLLLTAALPMALVDPRLTGTARTVVRVVWSLGLTLHLAFSQFDQEIVRWLSQHVSASYLRNFFGVNDPLLLQRILSGDRVPTGLAIVQVLVACTACAWWLRGQRTRGSHVSRRTLVWMLAGAVLFTSAHQWFRPSEKRWRRIQPAVVGLAGDVWRAASGAETPTDAVRAEQDLVDVAWTGRLGTNTQPAAAAYPLWRDDNVGTQAPAAFQSAPLSARPNVVVIVFETMRAWNTGLHPDTTLPSGTPQLDAFAQQHARVFPFLHSNGFPSVEGSMAMHLGIWPHFRRIIFSDYGHIRSQALPEALRAVGYDAFVLLGADPSFSNFTPWITRWYDRWEYTPSNHHDGPLVDRFVTLWDEATGVADQPVFGMLWTATTHPPYDLPASEGVPPGGDDEARFLQAIAYADRHVTRLLEHLRARPDWDRTVVLVLGDHAQPTPWQWQHSDRIGPLTPGHTWTQLVVTGGWPGLPARGRDDRTISHVDIPPSVLGLLDVRLPNHFMGRDVLGGDQPAPVAWDAPVAANDEAPLIPTFRMGDVVLLTPAGRAGFRIHGQDQWHIAIDRTREVEYGLLEGSTARIVPGLPDTIDPVRWRDLVLAWGRLLDDNRLMPPPDQAASPTP